MLFIAISAAFVVLMYMETIRKGMPIKRWLVLGVMLGPLAWYLFNVHYRRALVRVIGSQACCWRP
ncbi:hypothetical protein [Pseudoalteromonas mariniglutinosa]|uniref:hypothetical protein n=1 Tax=Pseudoalteromonas mariniglutinosa TaxID=206042 RepID=UPI00384DB941